MEQQLLGRRIWVLHVNRDWKLLLSYRLFQIFAFVFIAPNNCLKKMNAHYIDLVLMQVDRRLDFCWPDIQKTSFRIPFQSCSVLTHPCTSTASNFSECDFLPFKTIILQSIQILRPYISSIRYMLQNSRKFHQGPLPLVDVYFCIYVETYSQ